MDVSAAGNPFRHSLDIQARDLLRGRLFSGFMAALSCSDHSCAVGPPRRSDRRSRGRNAHLGVRGAAAPGAAVGAELVFAICEAKNVEVVILNQEEDTTLEEDLARDVLEIITVFSARLYGSRSRKNQKLLESVKKAVEESAEC